jgi:polar amino acid transport system substrate-binding protein
VSACDNFTNGHGFDSIIITAAAPTNDPIVLSTEICRKKGRIVVVGAVKMDVPRDPHFIGRNWSYAFPVPMDPADMM